MEAYFIAVVGGAICSAAAFIVVQTIEYRKNKNLYKVNPFIDYETPIY